MSHRSLLTLIAVLLALVAVPSAAYAEFGFAPDSLSAQALDADSNPEVRAGAHPDRLQIGFDFAKTGEIIMGMEAVDGNVKDIEVEMPSGMVANARAAATCPRDVDRLGLALACPPESQVGMMVMKLGVGELPLPLYNFVPGPGRLAELVYSGFGFGGTLAGRTSDDGRSLLINVDNVMQDIPLQGFSVELWGVPADHQGGGPVTRKALLTNPTSCGSPPVVTVRARSWQQPDAWKEAATAMGPTLTGCDSLDFDPQLDLQQDSVRTDSPTGVRVDVTVPQNEDPDGLANDRVGALTFELPEGTVLSPSAGSALVACSNEAARIEREGKATCPPASRIGTLQLTTPFLEDPVPGSIHIGPQLPGNDYRIFVVANDRGVNVKIAATLRADPVTGRLVAQLSNLPPFPFERMTLNFDGGPRAALATALTCGQGASTATFTPSGGGQPVTVADGVSLVADPLGGPCPASLPFTPEFAAGSTPARAGATARMSVALTRDDGEQLLDGFSMKLPAGLSARTAGVEQCSETAIAAAACPASSRVGAATVEVGSGSSPFVMRGDVFLTGPYRVTRPTRRTPFGMAFVLRALAGPFDLGTVVTRAAIRFDPATGQMMVDSDPLPRVLRGIPLRMRTLALDIDRRGFIVNPTSCDPQQIESNIVSTAGAEAARKVRFAVGGCSKLPFRSTVAAALTKRSELRAGGHPGLRLGLRSSGRTANLRAADIRLPSLLGARPGGGVSALCSRRQATAGRCPANARVGTAVARTALLSEPLRGSVYAVQPRGDGLPDIWSFIRVLGVSLTVRMENSTKSGLVHGKLVDLPDIPMSSVTLRLDGGKNGFFTFKRSPCAARSARRLIAKGMLVAHNDAVRRVRTRVAVPRCR